jgi:GMP synthase (glutamine-hydrolysing)
VSQPRAVAIRHVGFEDLGSFAEPLKRAGYEIFYVDAGVADLDRAMTPDPELLVVLGGPIGAYEEAAYPFLNIELNILQQRLAADRPTLGICLGAQLVARALGSRVYPGPAKEIGWGDIQLTTAGLAGPLRHLDGHRVLHWHGDTFDLPEGCERLASTAICENQAFARGAKLLGLQFHPEVLGQNIERWLIGHAAEIAAAGISPASIRQDTAAFGPDLQRHAVALLEDWLAGLWPA